MMTKHRKYILVQAIVVALVMVSFRLISEKQVASLIATSMFLLGAAYVLFNEWKSPQGPKTVSFWSTIGFLVVFVLPIIYLRVISWNGSFEEATFLTVTGKQFHKASNYGFLLMLACYFFDSLRQPKANN